MKTRKIMALVLSIVMVFSLCSTAMAYHLTDEITPLEQENSDLSMYIATQSYVLLENNGVLPLEAEGSVALFGNGVKATVKGGTGSGQVNNRANDNVYSAFVDAGWEIANPTFCATQTTTLRAERAITDEELAEATANTDLAIYVISRQAGEGSDRRETSGTSSFALTAEENANIALLAENFDRFVVVYNTCMMDTDAVRETEGVDAVFFMSNGGQRGSEALVKVLTGEYTPSGKLTDTWALDLDGEMGYPSTDMGFSWVDGNTATEWYNDGIYVGYRYFDTWGLPVAYEFGYGLSYTEFAIDVTDVEIDEENVTVNVDVTNIGGTYSGKEVVQVYFSAPDGVTEKPYQELAAYGKTDELEPGEKQSLTLTYATTDMSSYSEEDEAYVMDAGQYIIRVGNSSRNTQVAAVVTLDETTITEQLSTQVAPYVELEEISKEGQTPITYEGEAEEIAAAPVYAIAGAELPYENNASEYDDETITTYLFAEDAEDYVAREDITLKTKVVAGIQNNFVEGVGGYSTTTYDEEVEIVPALPEGYTKETVKLTDVYDGIITMEQFVASLTVDELAQLCVGTRNADGSNLPSAGQTMIGGSATSVRGGAGQTTQAYYYTRYIPSMPNADGPAGIRITQSYNLSAAQMSQTFDVEGSGRYVRINLSKPATQYGFSIYEWTVRSGDENVALNKPVTAKTEATSNGNLMSMINDGNNSTRWGSDWSGGDTVTSWVVIDLGEVYDLTSMTVYFEAAYANAYTIEVSDNGEDYTTIYETATENNIAYQFCTAFPAGSCYVMSWDFDLIMMEGAAIGKEMQEYGVTTWLAPGMNIHRNPLCGRNFEYYSEDPLVTGITAAYMTIGVQATPGIGLTLKHFWGNSQENNRNAVDNVISERASREIYLKGFEIAVKLGRPQAIMTCYNCNNGWPGADSYDLCTDLARGEWGFNGYIMTDWGGGQSTQYISMHAGNDIIMPGGDPSVITRGLVDNEPTWAEDGYVAITGSGLRQTAQWGEFTPDANGSVTFEVPVVGGYEAINANVWNYVDNGSAMVHYNEDGSYSVIWKGNYAGNIVLGDVQKSTMNILNVIMQSQDMAKMMAEEPFNREIELVPYSEANGALITEGWAMATKGEIVDCGLVAGTVVADCAVGEALVDITYTGEADISTVRFYIDSALPIADIYSDYEIEYNPAEDYVVIWGVDGIDDVVATIVYDISANPWLANGEYPIGIEVVDATDIAEKDIIVVGVEGAVIIDNTYAAGDANLDGMVSNADVINIARYLVELVEFNAEQIEAADVDEDGEVDNADLIKVARAIVQA